ncbi:hypothetical protein CZ674_11755 [Agrococcus casei LMG 22410]|uniref:Uncharacterized protein n=1 Tax=Agrococcus casei LMG 22410 TaxID=1255656 RepID=A0A1R4GG89_9MICO|nr:hypothetical protein CZ674_11755 [Agrococcus casei LMG 22410]
MHQKPQLLRFLVTSRFLVTRAGIDSGNRLSGIIFGLP